MSKTVTLKAIEKEYAQEIAQILENHTGLTADHIIALSQQLYENVKVKGISLDEDDEADMLLFQYGIYDKGDGNGKHFSFDITRQFITEDEDMYQLSLILVFDPVHFEGIERYNSWSSDFDGLDEWLEEIKETQGYEKAKLQVAKTYQLVFDQQ